MAGAPERLPPNFNGPLPEARRGDHRVAVTQATVHFLNDTLQGDLLGAGQQGQNPLFNEIPVADAIMVARMRGFTLRAVATTLSDIRRMSSNLYCRKLLLPLAARQATHRQSVKKKSSRMKASKCAAVKRTTASSKATSAGSL
jgi:hypothetical protein